MLKIMFKELSCTLNLNVLSRALGTTGRVLLIFVTKLLVFCPD